jgi:hypothetical protein
LSAIEIDASLQSFFAVNLDAACGRFGSHANEAAHALSQQLPFDAFLIDRDYVGEQKASFTILDAHGVAPFSLPELR